MDEKVPRAERRKSKAEQRAMRERRKALRAERKQQREAKRAERERKQRAIEHALRGDGAFAPATRDGKQAGRKEWGRCNCGHSEIVHGEKPGRTGCMNMDCRCQAYDQDGDGRE